MNRCFRKLIVQLFERDRKAIVVDRARLDGSQNGLDVLKGRAGQPPTQAFFFLSSASESSVSSAAYSRSRAR